MVAVLYLRRAAVRDALGGDWWAAGARAYGERRVRAAAAWWGGL